MYSRQVEDFPVVSLSLLRLIMLQITVMSGKTWTRKCIAIEQHSPWQTKAESLDDTNREKFCYIVLIWTRWGSCPQKHRGNSTFSSYGKPSKSNVTGGMTIEIAWEDSDYSILICYFSLLLKAERRVSMLIALLRLIPQNLGQSRVKPFAVLQKVLP